MANEARVFAEGPDSCLVRAFTVANATAIAKGTLMVQNGDRTAIAHGTSLLERAPLGFATMSKEASDGRTQIGLQRSGVVDALIDGTVTTGDFVITGQTTANAVQRLPNTWLCLYDKANLILGRAIESGTNGQVIKIAVALG